jgi:plastocyanin
MHLRLLQKKGAVMHFRIRLKVFSLLLTVLMFVMGCGDDSSDSPVPASNPPPTSGGTNPPPTTAENITVTIATNSMNLGNNAFGTNPLIVAPGTTVIWVNNDTVPHTSTSSNGIWDSEILNPGQSFSFKFNNTGDFSYFCEVHPSMRGMVRVTSTSSTNEPSPSPSPLSSPNASPGTGGY